MTPEELKTLSLERLRELLASIQAEINSRQEKKFEIVELAYNQYKGSGKCWVAKVDPASKKVLSFLEADSKQPRDNYSGQKTFSVPLVNDVMYLFCESGSKSSDSRQYKKVENGVLVDA